MAYNQAKLIKDTRIYIGGVSDTLLPEDVIIHWGDFFDADARYTGNYPYIVWKTTLSCLDYLKANKVSSSSNSKSSRKEKVGEVELTITEDNSTTSISYDDLYDDYSQNPWKFGVVVEAGSSVVLINGVNQATVDKYRNNTATTNPYSPLPTTAFPKVTGCTWRRTNSTTGRR